MYLIDEICQAVFKVYRFANDHSSIMRCLGYHFFDIWNIMDFSVVGTGLIGGFQILNQLRSCSNDGICNDKAMGTKIASCSLALTSVLLWVKVLYYMRPNPTAGKFGKLSFYI